MAVMQINILGIARVGAAWPHHFMETGQFIIPFIPDILKNLAFFP
jgi:hypothetical protein